MQLCPHNASEAVAYRLQSALSRGLVPNVPRWEATERDRWTAERVTSFGCLDQSTGALQLPLHWGDPPARQVPLFIRFEDYAEYLPLDIRETTFVQIGANCGKNTFNCAVGGDPIWSYATSCGWRGLAVEPVSYVFLELCKNYLRWQPRVLPLRAAVSDRPGVATIGLGGGETNKLMESRDRRRPGRNETVGVVSLVALWDHARRHLGRGTTERLVDVLAIDAEGQERRILGAALHGRGGKGSKGAGKEGSGGVPLPRPLPSLILFEHAHLHGPDLLAIHAHLRAQGYERLADLKNLDPRGKHMKPANRLYGLVTARRQKAAASARSD